MQTKVSVRKLTDEELLHTAASFTTGNESHMSLAAAYRMGHSIIRTQLFWIELREIPLFVASQLARSHVGVQFFQRSKRTDRGGKDFATECGGIVYDINAECMVDDFPSKRTIDRILNLPKNFDRYAPTDLAFICNAEAIINMSHKRLCTKASYENKGSMESGSKYASLHCPRACRSLCSGLHLSWRYLRRA